MIRLGDVFTIEGNTFVVRSQIALEGCFVYGITRIPDGMTVQDLGRYFEPNPIASDPTAYRLIAPSVAILRH